MSNFREIKFISVLRDIIIVTKDFIRELETMRHPWRQDIAPDRSGASVQSENCSSRPRKESGYQRQKYTDTALPREAKRGDYFNSGKFVAQ